MSPGLLNGVKVGCGKGGPIVKGPSLLGGPLRGRRPASWIVVGLGWNVFDGRIGVCRLSNFSRSCFCSSALMAVGGGARRTCEGLSFGILSDRTFLGGGIGVSAGGLLGFFSSPDSFLIFSKDLSSLPTGGFIGSMFFGSKILDLDLRIAPAFSLRIGGIGFGSGFFFALSASSFLPAGSSTFFVLPS